MRISVSISKRGMMLFGLVIAAALVLILAFSAYRFSRIQPCLRTSAVVTEIKRETYHSFNKINNKKAYFVSCTYQVDGKKYQCRFRTLFPLFYREGNTIGIFYNTQIPGLTADHFLLELAICAEIFLGVILIFCVAAIRKGTFPNNSG